MDDSYNPVSIVDMYLRSNGDDLYVLTTIGIVQDLHSPNEAKNKLQQHSVKHPQQVEAREAKIDSTK